jgi:hypothetical protein
MIDFWRIMAGVSANVDSHTEINERLESYGVPKHKRGSDELKHNCWYAVRLRRTQRVQGCVHEGLSLALLVQSHPGLRRVNYTGSGSYG